MRLESAGAPDIRVINVWFGLTGLVANDSLLTALLEALLDSPHVYTASGRVGSWGCKVAYDC